MAAVFPSWFAFACFSLQYVCCTRFVICVCQLCPVQAKVESEMLFAIRNFASGQGNLIIINDLECLSSFGMHTNFRFISATAQAAKLRVTFSTIYTQ